MVSDFEKDDGLDWNAIVSNVKASQDAAESKASKPCSCGGKLIYVTQQLTNTHDRYCYRCEKCGSDHAIEVPLVR